MCGQTAVGDSATQHMLTSAVANVAPTVFPVLTQTNLLQPTAMSNTLPSTWPSAGSTVTTSTAAFNMSSSAVSSDRTVPQSTSASSELLHDFGLLHIGSSSSSVVAAGGQTAVLASASTQPLASSGLNSSPFSADLLTESNRQSMCSSTLSAVYVKSVTDEQ